MRTLPFSLKSSCTSILFPNSSMGFLNAHSKVLSVITIFEAPSKFSKVDIYSSFETRFILWCHNLQILSSFPLIPCQCQETNLSNSTIISYWVTIFNVIFFSALSSYKISIGFNKEVKRKLKSIDKS